MIVDFMARVAVQNAIRGKTVAGAAVLNSPMMALKGIVDASTEFSPVITVSSADHDSDTEGQELRGGKAKAIMSIGVFIPPSARFTFDGRQYEVKGQGPFAAALGDIIIYQVMQALADAENAWARMWARLAVRIVRFNKSPPYLEIEEGLTVPSRFLAIEYQPLADPVAGRPMTATFSAFHDMMLADQGLKGLAPIFKMAIEEPSGRPDWAYAIMQLGLSDVAGTNSGLRPLEPEGDELTQAGTYDEDPEEDGIVVLPTTAEGAL